MKEKKAKYIHIVYIFTGEIFLINKMKCRLQPKCRKLLEIW